MKILVNSLNCRPAAWALALCVCTLFIVASPLAFSQVSFEKLWEVNHPADYPIFPGFSKDGKFIYAGGNGGIMQMDASNGQFIKYLDKGFFTMGATESMTILPDGEHAFTKNKNTGYIIWDLNIGKAIKLFPYGKNRFEKALGVTISPDLKYLTFTILDSILPNKPLATEDCTFYIYDIEKERIKDSMRLWGYQALFAIAPNGKSLASVGLKNESKDPNKSDLYTKVFLWNTENWTYSVIDNIKGIENSSSILGVELAFSVDSKYLYWVGFNRRLNHLYDVINRTLLSSSDISKDCYRVVFLPDSQTYGFCYNDVEIFDLKTNESRGKLNYQVYNWAASPQSKLFLAYDIDKQALFKMKSLGINQSINKDFATAVYQDGYIQIRYILPVIYPVKLSIIDLNGKEIYRSDKLIPEGPILRIPMNLPSGLYVIKIIINSKEYSTKLEVTR